MEGAINFRGHPFGRSLRAILQRTSKRAGYTSNLWVAQQFVDLHGFQPKKTELPFVYEGQRAFYNLDQFVDTQRVLDIADADGHLSANKMRFAHDGSMIRNQDAALSIDLARCWKERGFRSVYWDTHDGFAEYVGLTILPGAEDCSGYYNVDQLSSEVPLPETRFHSPSIQLHGPKGRHVIAAVRRFLFTLNDEQLRGMSALWGTASAFARVRVGVVPGALSVQAIDPNGCATHWYNANSTSEPRRAEMLLRASESLCAH